tara:strand:+ start:661 stop:1452 length:792 start_codon:yes stop_codon:yes gene_type:complete
MPRISKKIKLNCHNCNKEYFRPPSKAKNSRFCSRICANTFFAQEAKVPTEERSCKNCNKKFIVSKNRSQKFCSKECVGEFLKKPRVNLECNYCKKKYVRPEGRETKYCSKTCHSNAQSSGLIELPSCGRKGYRRDLPENYFFKSSLEADYARYCDITKVKYIYEHKTFNVILGKKQKSYTPDFYLPEIDLYVETKALRRDKKFNSNLTAVDFLKKEGLNIEVMYMDQFYRKLREEGYYYLIENLENKNYLGTRQLIYTNKNDR